MRWRYITVLIFFAVCLFAISGKLFYWQVVKASELQADAEAQYGDVVQLIPQRGEIKAADGFPLVTNRLSYLVFANPKEIKNVGAVSNTLAPLLEEDKASISALLDMDKYWVSLKQNADYTVKNKIDALQIPGVGFEQTYTRFYPEASMAAQLLGFVGKDDAGNPKGYFGVEGYYDAMLKGRIGQAKEIHDALGRPVLSQLNDDSGEQDGRSLTLHIDRSIQYIVEQKLKDGVQKYGAQSGEVIVMDPKTGGILAMASFPSFDPRDFTDFDEGLFKNPVITNTYEPGSTFKPLIMSAAIDAGLVKPETTCPICGGPVTIGGYTIETWDKKHFPNETMMDILKNSDNDGMIYVSELLGHDKMLSYIHKFGIGNTTGIDLQGEEAVPLKSDKTWYPIDYATASFGQGISVTPIELLDAFSSIANNGQRMEPHVVSSITTPQGQTIPIEPKVLDQVISPQTAKIMTEMLVYTVNKGEASFARLKGYRIAGKTGTASIPVSGHYDPTQTIASFIGFAPADDPKFSMLVIMDRPTSSIYGAETAAPIFFDIAKEVLAYYGIAPTGSE